MLDELFLDVQPRDRELLDAITAVCGVPREAVLITGDSTTIYKDDLVGKDILAIRRANLGQFPMWLEVIPQQEELLDRIVTGEQRGGSSFPSAMCQHLRCHALVSDDDVDPSSWWLFGPDGARRHVHVDPDALSEDRFILVESDVPALVT